jgi:hypothetical protein
MGHLDALPDSSAKRFEGVARAVVDPIPLPDILRPHSLSVGSSESLMAAAMNEFRPTPPQRRDG